ncbi:unnamed protein product [Rotaria magnacalcarata]|uniref:DH domain-containing protein n=3 Tax=Rotaria magnacalcarata TaxID=392030 RepID=A0A816X250_9BILA|nr:unnamed protein product [Rotaria magnacalcarata]CAF3842053.1 unnamed protein product [Rotaria magnacalcarata]
MMIRTRLSSRSFQSRMNDETFSDDLTTLNQNSSSSILHRTFNVHCASQEYVIRKENSSQVTTTESIQHGQLTPENTKTEDETTESLQHLLNLTPRNISMIELITTEQRFVHDMKNILKTYIKPMSETNILSSSHIDALFLNWPSLTRTHEKLANKLINALKNDGEDMSIGKILCEFIPQLVTEYEIYFRFHPAAMKCFREHLNISSKFRAFMQKTKQESHGIGTMGDANILTLPLQRIAKYPFMIYQILKNTANNHHDYIELHNSLKEANELRETINNAIDEEINRAKFEWLQQHVDCTKINETIIFNSLTHFGEQRKLLHYSHMRMTKSTNHLLYAMLFNDFLLLTRIKRPLITKVLQIINQTRYNYRQHRYIYKPSMTQTNKDWFDSIEANHLYLVVHKKPIMLHDIRNVRIAENDPLAFQFDYHGCQMIFVTNDINERLLWIKNINDAVHICRQKRLVTSMLRAPESNLNSVVCQPIGKIFIREINAMNLPLISLEKNGHNPYCIIEMNNHQRQTTPVLCDTAKLQWNVLFRFLICNINNDVIKCSIYNRSKYTKDRLLGSIEIPIRFLVKRGVQYEDASSIYSLKTNYSMEISSLNCRTRTFYLENSSKNSQISIKYIVYLSE